MIANREPSQRLASVFQTCITFLSTNSLTPLNRVAPCPMCLKRYCGLPDALQGVYNTPNGQVLKVARPSARLPESCQARISPGLNSPRSSCDEEQWFFGRE